MTVQIKPSKPKDQHNALAAFEQQILDAPKGTQWTAVVTYEREKRIEDEKKDETYPVLGIKHIELITTPEALAAVQEHQLEAYKSRTGENELDFNFDADDDADESDDEPADTAGKK